ncbi:hypothetical protein AGOR_G00120510 [Albula goreensis]|uniref:Uncharacterized protein n=1 Tax=Albula goreensis TaxID=1534307 RepID=A0A8T3DBN1_9TELE|nr:hypothetical protein AGOR_G00120510 [Albula goreensis]
MSRKSRSQVMKTAGEGFCKSYQVWLCAGHRWSGSTPLSLWSGLKPHGNRSRVERLAANQTPPAHVALMVLRDLLLCCLGSLLLPSIPK